LALLKSLGTDRIGVRDTERRFITDAIGETNRITH
jgi:hypothetical protein